MQCLEVKKGQALTIDWLDSKALAGWNRTITTDPATIRSLGYVVASDNEAISITTSFEDSGWHFDALSIPWGCITRIDILPDDWAREGPDEPISTYS